jgi:cytochrome c biogenesis protein CcmG/thiol:disulfide interchange protein DsbE
VWATWCVPCRDEHPVLVELAKQKLVPLIGSTTRTERPTAMRWLARFGNPYDARSSTPDGRVGIDYGVYGVPETFVIDKPAPSASSRSAR